MIKIILGILFFGIWQIGYAGNIEIVKSPNTAKFSPFISLEGSGSWVAYGNSRIEKISEAGGGGEGSSGTGSIVIVSSGKSRVNPFGGRIAGGIGYYYRDQVMLVAETGWNYFGDASRTSHGDRNYNVSGILVGADLLLGLDYLYNEHIALFGRAGTLLEQVIYSASSPNARGTINGTSLNVSGSMSGAQTNILPELKIGVLYRYTDAWGMSFAYMHAFGGNPALNGTFITSGSRTSSVTGQINTRNPSINSFLLGLKYSFC